MGLIQEAEKFFQCCGYDEADQKGLNITEQTFCKTYVSQSCSFDPPPTNTGTTNAAPENATSSGKRRKRDLSVDCFPCKNFLDDKIDRGFNAAGGLGLFFALTEVC